MRIVFRTEGNHRQGLGDLWGCIALAKECLRRSDETAFMISEDTQAQEILEKEGLRFHGFHSLSEEQEFLRSFCPDVVVVNKLNNFPEYIRALKSLAGLVVTMEDTAEGAQLADLRINILYHTPRAVTEISYMALRREFQKLHCREKPSRRQVQKLLITQGGSDTYGFTPKVVRALEGMAHRPHVWVVTGPAFRHQSQLKEALAASTLDLTHIHDATNLARLMHEADLAISAGGITLFELACVGTPAIAICGEPFEVETALRLEGMGTVVNLGFGGNLNDAKIHQTVDRLAADFQARQRMSLRGKSLVDGRGAERIMGLIRDQLVLAARTTE